MKKFLNVHPLSADIDAIILIVRIAAASLMLSHGLPKLMMLLSGDPVMFPSVFGLSAGLSLALAVFAEAICSIFILFGFGTRLAVIPLILTMLTAVLHIHAADPFAKKELGLLYITIYLVLLAIGSGRFSLDYIFSRKAGKIRV